MSSLTLNKLIAWMDAVNSDTESRREPELAPKYSISALLTIMPVIAGTTIWHNLANRTGRKARKKLLLLVRPPRFDAETRESLKTIGEFYTLDSVAILRPFALSHFAVLYELLLHCRSKKEWLLLLTKLWFNFCVSFSKHLRGRTFVVDQDFRGREGILCQLKSFTGCKVICLPHGLISSWVATTYGTFPGMWSDVALAYDLKTAEAMKYAAKNTNLLLTSCPKVFALGPICFRNKAKGVALGVKYRLIFISSALEQYMHPGLILSTIETAALTAHCDFEVRWHPHEREASQILYPYAENIDEKHTLLMREEPIIFVGMFSTFLYEADCMGFKTIWLTDVHLKSGEPPCLPENLINGVECRLDDFDGAVLESVKASSIKSPAFRPVVDRLADIISLSA